MFRRILGFFSQRIWFPSKVKLIFLVYLLIIMIASVLLYLPITQYKDGAGVSYLNSLFISASAFSDTGLSTVTLAENWNYLGQAIVAVLILIGGFGFFAIKIYVFNFLLRKRLSTISNSFAFQERAGLNLGTAKETVFVSLTVLFMTLFFSSILLTFFFYFLEGNFQETQVKFNPKGNILMSLRFGIFHAISAINNAGFDIIGNSSLQPYYHVLPINIVLMFLFILGGIGYPIIFDLYTKIKNTLLKKPIHRFSLLTKLSLFSYFFTSLFGFLFIFLSEFLSNSSFFLDTKYGSNLEKGFALFFVSLSTRSAGFTTIEINDLLASTKIVLFVLMFIGAAPFSTAGGIRATTFGIIFMIILSKMRGSERIDIFKRRVGSKTINQATAVFSFALFLMVIFSLIIVLVFENIADKIPSVVDIIFETCSAFGTAGLSTGITAKANSFIKFLLIFLMFVGQLGISSTLFLIRDNRSNNVSHVINEIPIP